MKQKSNYAVLFVDDEEVLRTVMGIALKRAGYKVILASNGKEALEILAEENHIFLAIIDMIMPDMSGQELIRKIEESGYLIKKIGITGYSGIPVEGVELVLYKPFLIDRLIVEINNLLK